MKLLPFFLSFYLFADLVIAQKPQITIPDDYSADRDVVYSDIGSPQQLDIYYLSSGEPLPLIIWIHGGAWRSGDKRSARFARELLGQGYAVASINYRLTGEAIFPAQIIDCKSAVRWLRANAEKYNLDPTRFAAWGGSAGAHLTALLGTAEDMPEWEKGDFLEYSSRVQAVVDWFGPTDFTRMDDEPGKMVHLVEGSPESNLIGGAVKDNPEKAAYANPITYVSKTNPPFQILHGKDDDLVLPNQAVLLNEAFLKIGKTPDFEILENTGHGGNEWNDQIPRAKAFLDKHFIESKDRARPEADTVSRQRRWTNTYFDIPDNLEYHRFVSETIKNDYGFFVYLPPSYMNATTKRYPVIYWLPGRGGNPRGSAHYVDLYDQAIKEHRAPEAIVICVNGINSSMYTNSKDGQWPIESVIINDLVPYVDKTFRTIPKREMRAIDGFSMGGYGAAKYGFSYPDVFGVISIIGGALHRPATLSTLRSDIYQQVFDGDMAYCKAENPWTIVEENADRLHEGIRIRQFIGENDEILRQKNIEFHELMEKLDIPHQFGIVPVSKHNYHQVYENWKGDPFEFYLTAFTASPDH